MMNMVISDQRLIVDNVRLMMMVVMRNDDESHDDDEYKEEDDDGNYDAYLIFVTNATNIFV